jgi:hypothetical protein
MLILRHLNPLPQRRVRIEQELHPRLWIHLGQVLVGQAGQGGGVGLPLAGRFERVGVRPALTPAGEGVALGNQKTGDFWLPRHGDQPVRADHQHEEREGGDVPDPFEAEGIHPPL